MVKTLKNKNCPKVSIIMPVFNVEKFVVEAINCIKNQTFTDWELIIIEDCSTDGTRVIVEKEGEKDKRIRILKNTKNSGITVSLNKGLKQAGGNFIARMDGDDLCNPDRLEKQVSFLEKNPKYVLLGTCGEIIDSEGKKKGLITFPKNNFILKLKLLEYCCFIHGSVMLRRDVFKKIPGYSSKYKYAEDYYLWLTIMKYGKIGNLAESLYSWRRNDTPSQKNTDIQRESARQLLVEIFESKDYKFEKLLLKIIFLYRKIKQCILKSFKSTH